MDRPLVQPGMILPDTILLAGWKNALYGLGHLAKATLGTSTCVSGLTIAATSPASLSVTIGDGSIYYFGQADATAYGSLGTDSNSLVKQGILAAPVTLTLSAPSTSGYSQVYLVEASYTDADGGATVEPYYNSANPSQPFSGPANSGTAQYTVRAGVLNVALKAGTAAPTGSQAAPAVDSGYVALYTITVANGQSTITSSNWSVSGTAPFVPLNLNQIPLAIQQQLGNYAVDTGTANAVAIALPSYTALIAGVPIRIKKSNSANTAAVTIAVNGGSGITARWADGTAFAAGDWPSGTVGSFTYDGTYFNMTGVNGPTIFARTGTTRPKLSGATSIYINSSTGSDSNSGTSASPFLTLQAAINYAQIAFDLNGQTLTFVATGTFTGAIILNGLFTGQIGPTGLVLNLTSATLATVNTCVLAQYGAQCTITGGVFSSSGSSTGQGYGVSAAPNSQIVLSGGHTFGVCVNSQIIANGGIIQIAGNYTINGNAYAHFQAFNLGQIGNFSAATVTLTGTPAFSGYFAGADYGYIGAPSLTFSGSATGVRYLVADYGRIYTNGGGASYFPGNSAGSVSAGTYS